MRTLLSTTRDRFLLALQYQDYRNLWIATTFSASAAWALIIARGWLAFEITDGSLWVGVVTLAGLFSSDSWVWSFGLTDSACINDWPPF